MNVKEQKRLPFSGQPMKSYKYRRSHSTA